MLSVRRSGLLVFFSRKIVFYVVTFFVSLSLVWLLPHLMPGNPVAHLVFSITSGSGQTEVLHRLYLYWVQKFGLNEPLDVQYVIFIKNMVTFNFGPSIVGYPTMALAEVLFALPWSLLLLGSAVVVGLVIGVYLGAAAAFQKGIYDKLLYPFFLVGSNMPYYWFALVLVAVFAATLHIFPAGSAWSSNWIPQFSLGFIQDFLWHFMLPFISLVIPYIGSTAIIMRTTTQSEISSDYMEYSESLGLSRIKLLKYALKNALLPLLSQLPLYIGGAFAGQVVLEVVFNYPGIGLLIYNSILNKDFNVVQCAFTFIILVVLIGNFMIDILYVYVDPRIRLAYKGEKS